MWSPGVGGGGCQPSRFQNRHSSIPEETMNTKIITKLAAIALSVPMLIATAEGGNARGFLVLASNSGRPAGAGLGHFMSFGGSRTIAGHPFRALPRHTSHPRQGQDGFGRPHGPFAGSGQ